MIPTSKIYCGDALVALQALPENNVHCCVTSPPYYGLRDYGAEGQIGLEDTPKAYIDRLVSVFREMRRVLRNDGTLWVNIGDSYVGTGGDRKYAVVNPIFNAQQSAQPKKGRYAKKKHLTEDGLKPKDMIGIPWMLAFALRDDGWYLRQDIIWSKPNPMPESVKDRCTKSHEHIFLLSKSPHYYYDAAAIAEPVAESTVKRLAQDIDSQSGSDRVPGKSNGPMKAVAPRYGGKKYTDNPDIFNRTKSGNAYDYKPYRNKRDVWTVSTKPFKGAHFATFPTDLIEPCVLAGCPVGGTVLDMFAGSGTTGLVALGNDRNFVGIEINPSYADMARNRIFKATAQLPLTLPKEATNESHRPAHR